MGEKSFGGFLGNNIGWTFNFVAIQILFWWQGFPTVLKYGYSNDEFNSKGGIPSGGDGSGVFIITVLLFIVTTIIYVARIKAYFCECDDKSS